MKGVLKGAPPACFTDWLAQANEDWQPSYGNFSGAPKHGTHDALLVEQGYVCIYCGGRIVDRSDSHIEHFRPQSEYNELKPPDLTLSYDNLFASCGPNRHPDGHPERRPLICGEAKGDWFSEEEHVDPKDPDCEQHFRYGLQGVVYQKPDANGSAAKMIDVLKLNDPSLAYERRVLLSGIEADITAGTITAANKPTNVAFFRAVDPSGRRLSFGHVAARYLEDEI